MRRPGARSCWSCSAPLPSSTTRRDRRARRGPRGFVRPRGRLGGVVHAFGGHPEKTRTPSAFVAGRRSLRRGPAHATRSLRASTRGSGISNGAWTRRRRQTGPCTLWGLRRRARYLATPAAASSCWRSGRPAARRRPLRGGLVLRGRSIGRPEPWCATPIDTGARASRHRGPGRVAGRSAVRDDKYTPDAQTPNYGDLARSDDTDAARCRALWPASPAASSWCGAVKFRRTDVHDARLPRQRGRSGSRAARAQMTKTGVRGSARAATRGGGRRRRRRGRRGCSARRRQGGRRAALGLDRRKARSAARGARRAGAGQLAPKMSVGMARRADPSAGLCAARSPAAAAFSSRETAPPSPRRARAGTSIGRGGGP